VVWYRGVAYRLNLERCRRALVLGQVDGKFGSMEALAAVVVVSRSTVSRFLSGRPTSLDVTVRILAALGLRFEDVAKPLQGHGDAA
jgi:transcriptional regulator with XRE-family HTH domain